MSHATCTHPRTPAGRAACRKAGGPVTDSNNIHTATEAKIDAAFPIDNTKIGAEMAKRKPVRKNNAQDRRIDAGTDDKPVRGRRGKVNTSDMPGNVRVATEWAVSHGCTWVGVEHRAGQVTIEIAGPKGTASIAYSRENPVGVQAMSFRPNGTSVTSRVASINDVLRMVK